MGPVASTLFATPLSQAVMKLSRKDDVEKSDTTAPSTPTTAPSNTPMATEAIEASLNLATPRCNISTPIGAAKLTETGSSFCDRVAASLPLANAIRLPTWTVTPSLKTLCALALVLFAPAMFRRMRTLYTRRALVELATEHSSVTSSRIIAASLEETLKRWWSQLMKLRYEKRALGELAMGHASEEAGNLLVVSSGFTPLSLKQTLKRWCSRLMTLRYVRRFLVELAMGHSSEEAANLLMSSSVNNNILEHTLEACWRSWVKLHERRIFADFATEGAGSFLLAMATSV